MYNNWGAFDNFLQEDINISNHSSLCHKGRIALKHNEPKEEKKKEAKNLNTWRKNEHAGRPKKKKPEVIIYTDGKKHLSAEHILNISKNHADMRGEKNPMFGRKHSPETIMKLKMICKCMEGENNPMFGRKHTEETKAKMAKKRNRPLLVGGRFFESIKDAMANVVISIKDLRGRIAEEVPGYKFLEGCELEKYIGEGNQ